MKFLFLFLLIAPGLHAYAHDDNDLTHRPPSFEYGGESSVFVDFQEVTYEIVYDIPAQRASVKASFKMTMPEEGLPLFDLIADPTAVNINGTAVTTEVIPTPSRETRLRRVKHKLTPGFHELTVEAPITTLLEFSESSVKNAFWVTDLKDRFYLERFIPSNLEFDRIKMTFDIHFKGLKALQHVFANGKVSWLTQDRVRVEFPDNFTVNSLYFHTTPVGSVALTQFAFSSVGKREIPVTIYTKVDSSAAGRLAVFKSETLKVLRELEADYGSFPHDSITIYEADLSSMGLGGMEYAGATVTNLSALGHELFHSYFARGIVPANGNAGWIDEALASWRDDGYLRLESLHGSSRMAAHPIYTRKTDTAAYSFGSEFMSYLDHKTAMKGGLKPFLNDLLSKKLFTPIFTEEFVAEMESYFGEELMSTFQKYVYGKGIQQKFRKIRRHPIHGKLDPLKMQGLL